MAASDRCASCGAIISGAVETKWIDGMRFHVTCWPVTAAEPHAKLRDALAKARADSASLACGSSSCPHSRHKGGQMVNGPCRCYGHDTDPAMRAFVFAATRLISAADETLNPKQ